jgi:hypothetical protein
MTRRHRILLVLLAISGIGYFPFSQWISTTRIGTTYFLWGQLYYGLALMAAVVAIPILSVTIFFKRSRPHSVFFLFLSILFVPCCIAGIILGRKTRMAGMESCGQRARPLITAIEQYERDHSTPPDSLHDLVPDYLPNVPSTGMMAYPEFRYHSGNQAKEEYDGNPWALSIYTPSGGINFDMMLYFPNQNYPDRGYGGSLERLGDWAYVHE